MLHFGEKHHTVSFPLPMFSSNPSVLDYLCVDFQLSMDCGKAEESVLNSEAQVVLYFVEGFSCCRNSRCLNLY